MHIRSNYHPVLLLRIMIPTPLHIRTSDPVYKSQHYLIQTQFALQRQRSTAIPSLRIKTPAHISYTRSNNRNIDKAVDRTRARGRGMV